MKKIEWLEAMRGFAAIWVLLHHAGLATAHFAGQLGPAYTPIANGYLGVDFFFVLSGFIIAMSCERIIARGHGLRHYARARLIRIFVPYLPVGIAMLCLYTLLPGASRESREVGVVTSLTLLPTSLPPALSVAWSLVHELIFYAVFALIFVSRRVLDAVLACWTLIILAVWQLGIGLTLFSDYFLTPLNLCFILGALLFRMTQGEVGARLGKIATGVGLVLVLSQVVAIHPNRVVIAIGFAALITAAISAFWTLRPPARPLVVLGAASYAIYLAHNPALSFLERVLAKIAPTTSPALAMTVISAGALLCGLLYHVLFERRAIRWITGVLANRESMTVASPQPQGMQK